MSKKDIRKEAQVFFFMGIKLMFARVFMPQAKYNKKLNELISEIDNNTINKYCVRLVDMIKFSKKTSAMFSSAKNETDSVLKTFPTLKNHYNLVFNTVKYNRNKSGLGSMNKISKKDILKDVSKFGFTASLELMKKGSNFLKIQRDSNANQSDKDKTLNDYLESLSPNTFATIAPTIISNLTFSEEHARKFNNSEEQTDAYIQKRPIMITYRDEVLGRIKEFRQKCGLNI